MAIINNNTDIQAVNYNGTVISSIIVDGKKVWPTEHYLNFKCDEEFGISFEVKDTTASSDLPCYKALEYSYDKTNWTTTTVNGIVSDPIVVPANTTIYFRGTNNEIFTVHDTETIEEEDPETGEMVPVDTYDVQTTWGFSFSTHGGKISVGGDITSLFDDETPLPYEACWLLFARQGDLKDASELVISGANEHSFSQMFEEAGLVTAPQLTDQTMAPYCYEYMFTGCASLELPPELPAITLDEGCYYGMFYECTQLRAIPELPATEYASECYNEMFSGCSSLLVSDTQSSVYNSPFSLPSSETYQSDEVASDMFANTGNPNIDTPRLNTTYFYVSSKYYDGYFWIKCELSGQTIHLSTSTSGTYPSKTFEYSTDLENWTSISFSDMVSVGIPTPENRPVYIRSNDELGFTYYQNSMDIYDNTVTYTYPHNFVLSGNSGTPWIVGGNIQSLFNNSATLPDGGCLTLFEGQNVTDVSRLILSARTVGGEAYKQMFQNCAGLTNTPIIAATTFGFKRKGYTRDGHQDWLSVYDNCNDMFNNCTSLQFLPSLPATTLAENCYKTMFAGCTSVGLSATQTGIYQNAYRIPASGTGITASGALTDMFDSTGGTFTGTPNLGTTYYTSNTVI